MPTDGHFTRKHIPGKKREHVRNPLWKKRRRERKKLSAAETLDTEGVRVLLGGGKVRVSCGTLLIAKGGKGRGLFGGSCIPEKAGSDRGNRSCDERGGKKVGGF